VEIKALVAHRLHPRHHHRQVLGTTARHHRVDRDLFDRGLAPTRRDRTDDVFSWTARGRNHARHLLSGRHDDREPVGSAALEKQLVVVVDSRHRRKCRNAIRFLDKLAG
jgi:hypothetical protein